MLNGAHQTLGDIKMVSKTPAELAEMTPAERKEHFAAEERTVFGADFKRDKHGRPIEQGVGSPGHEDERHFAAIRKYEGIEAEQKARAEAAKRRQP
jgi:hypothetical protein